MLQCSNYNYLFGLNKYIYNLDKYNAAFRSRGITLISFLISLIILGLVFGIIWWILDRMPIPAPFNMIVRVLFGLILIIALLGMIGIGPGIGLGSHNIISIK